MKRILPKQQGFTIIELMIATSVFTMILLLCSYAVISIGRTYYRGVTATRTQETTRKIMEEVTDAIRFGGSGIDSKQTTAGGIEGFCLGNIRFSYLKGKQLMENPSLNGADEQVKEVMKVNDYTCGDTPSFVGGRELMSQRMRLERFEVTGVPGSDGLYKITIRVISGENDLLEDRDSDGFRECKNQLQGGEYCAVSELSTIVDRRI